MDDPPPLCLPEVDATLAALRAAADAVRQWPVTTWTRQTGPGPDQLELVGVRFPALVLEPGERLTLATDLHVPERAGGLLLDDDLEISVNSLYPCRLTWDGRPLMDDLGTQETMAAPSPALVHVLGTRGRLELTVEAPDHDLMPWWVQLTITTSGLRRRFEALDLAWARLELAAAEARRTGDQAAAVALGEAAAALPDDLLALDAAELALALDGLWNAVAPVSPVSMPEVHLIGHAHIDLCWLWTWSDTERTVMRDLRTIVGLMDEFPELTFTHSQPATYEVVRRQDPALFSRIRELVRDGRWEAATMTWVEGDNLLVGGESLARQIEHGVDWSVEHLGVRPSVYMAPDNFGHTGNLPQLAVTAGAVAYFHMRCNPGVDDLWPAYWWEGLDGTQLLALSTPKYTGEITAGDLARAAVRSQDAGLPVAMHLHGLGDHGGGPARQHLETLRRLTDTPGLPGARCSTIAAVAAAIIAADPPLPVHRGESTTIFEGCYSSQRGTKARNRGGENRLVTAEALAAMAGLDVDLDDAWKALLFNQFHDILAGSSIGAVHQEQTAAHDRAQVTVEAEIERNLQHLVGPRSNSASTFAVVNPLGRARSDIVEVALDPGDIPLQPLLLRGDNGHQAVAQPTATGLCFVADVAGWSTVVYRSEGPAMVSAATLSVSTAFNRGGPQVAVLDAPDIAEPPFLVVDTPHLQAHVRRDSGIIAGLLDKRTGLQLVGYGLRRRTDYLDVARHDLALNVLQLIEERPHGMSAWQLGEVWRETTLLGAATTAVVESGPVRIVLEVGHRLGRSSIRQRLTFYRDLVRIDAETDIDWQERAGPERGVPSLKVAFTASVPATEAWFETPFGAVARNADGQEVAAQRWAWVGSPQGGLAVVNDSTYAHDALGSRLRLTLVRGSYSPDPHADLGRHQVRYSMIPTLGRWQDSAVVDQAAGVNQPLVARPCGPGRWGAGEPSRLREVIGDGVGVSGVRRRGGEVGVRLYDASGTGCQAGDGENGAVVRLAPFEVGPWTRWDPKPGPEGRERPSVGE